MGRYRDGEITGLFLVTDWLAFSGAITAIIAAIVSGVIAIIQAIKGQTQTQTKQLLAGQQILSGQTETNPQAAVNNAVNTIAAINGTTAKPPVVEAPPNP